MIKKRNIIASLFHFKNIFFLLSVLILRVNAETKIIAKDGDTLLKISNQYDIPLKELMHKNNVIDANRVLEGEVIIIPLNNNNTINLTYKVKEGDTLYKIARNYNVNIEDLISINNLDKSSFLKQNQTILLPNGAIQKEEFTQKNITLANSKVFYHQTSKVEEITEIAGIHGLTVESIVNLNNLGETTKVNPNTKLKLREPTTSKWLNYGILKISWSDWRYLDGNYITKAKNKKNKSFYLAINCSKRILNNTLNTSYWTNWYFPEIDFEFKLINDFCDQNSKI